MEYQPTNFNEVLVIPNSPLSLSVSFALFYPSYQLKVWERRPSSRVSASLRLRRDPYHRRQWSQHGKGSTSPATVAARITIGILPFSLYSAAARVSASHSPSSRSATTPSGPSPASSNRISTAPCGLWLRCHPLQAKSSVRWQRLHANPSLRITQQPIRSLWLLTPVFPLCLCTLGSQFRDGIARFQAYRSKPSAFRFDSSNPCWSTWASSPSRLTQSSGCSRSEHPIYGTHSGPDQTTALAVVFAMIAAGRRRS